MAAPNGSWRPQVFSGRCRCGHAWDDHRLEPMTTAGTKPTEASSHPPYRVFECDYHGSVEQGALLLGTLPVCTYYVDQADPFWRCVDTFGRTPATRRAVIGAIASGGILQIIGQYPELRADSPAKSVERFRDFLNDAAAHWEAARSMAIHTGSEDLWWPATLPARSPSWANARCSETPLSRKKHG